MTATLDRVRELAPTVAKRSEEIERAGELPADLVDELTVAGCFRMLVPRSHGGDEFSLPEVLAVVEALAKADGATGWTTGILAATPLILAQLPRATFDALYAGGPNLRCAGALAPKGAAVATDGGWRISGQWPFVTGCGHADWVYLHCVEYDQGAPVIEPDGTPRLRMALLPADLVRFSDTWHVLGLRGTGSDDARVNGVTCPAERTGRLFGGTPSIAGAGFALSVSDQLGFFLGAVAVGIADGAVEEVCALATAGKRPAFSPHRLAGSPVFQDRLGEARMDLLAARALLTEQAGLAWADAAAGREPAAPDRAARRATGSRVTALAKDAVDTAYGLAGGSAVYERSPLQRRLRDIHTATQHAVTGRDFYRALGAALVGEHTDYARR